MFRYVSLFICEPWWLTLPCLDLSSDVGGSKLALGKIEFRSDLVCPDDPSPPQRPARANKPLCLALGYTCPTCIGTPGADRLKKNLKVFCRMWKDHAVDGSFEVRCQPDWTEAAGCFIVHPHRLLLMLRQRWKPLVSRCTQWKHSRRRWSRFASWAFEGGGGSHVRFVDLSVPSAFSTWMVNSMYFTYTNYPIR